MGVRERELILGHLELAARLAANRKQRPLQYATPSALAQVDDSRWLEPPHIKALDAALLALSQRHIRRLIVEMPPRHGKSFMCSKYFPAWYLSQHPEQNVILASYEANFATLWGRRVRDVVTAHSERLGFALREDSKAAGAWETTQGGGMFCTGVGGPMTGRGANVLIIDDPVKNRDEAESVTYRERTWEWWQSTAYTRLEPDAVVIVIMTRWHSDDLAGRLLRQVDDGEPWEVLRLPAIAEEDDPVGRAEGEALWPERYAVGKLYELRRRIGEYWWASLYQQRPAPREGALWKWDWIEQQRVEVPPQLERIVIAIDPAGSTRKHADQTGIVLAAKGEDRHYYVMRALGLRVSPNAWAERAAALYQNWRADRIVAEKNYGGEMVEATLRRVRPDLPITMVQASRGKVLRAEPIAALYEQGRVHHVGRFGELEEQMTSFPVSNEHDDLVDALVYALTDLMEAGGEYDDQGFVGGY